MNARDRYSVHDHLCTLSVSLGKLGDEAEQLPCSCLADWVCPACRILEHLQRADELVESLMRRVGYAAHETAAEVEGGAV